MSLTRSIGALLAGAVLAPAIALASSHREAPAITGMPKVDATDFYMFNSYEAGRSGFVTLIANYLPLQAAYGGPNYFALDPNALYEIHVDNDGDAVEDITFQFQFQVTYAGTTLDIGGQAVAVPLTALGAIGPNAADTGNRTVQETFSAAIVRGDRRQGTRQSISNVIGGATTFRKPADNIGQKTIASYAAYADQHIYDVTIPGCAGQARLFAGQRKDPFAVNLGEVFDLVNTNPVGARNAELNVIDDANVTTIALEVPVACLTEGGGTVLGGWTTASVRQGKIHNPRPTSPANAAVMGGAWTQVSRLGHPLVNEVVIGLPDKDRFNASEPKDDGQFATYVTNPTLPAILNVLFGVQAPTTPRNDLVAIFLTGVTGLNQPTGVTASEMLRLNTAIAAVPAASQDSLGVLGGDNAGFPNGRRPGDDVVDIALRAVMGVLLDNTAAPDGQLPYTDGALQEAAQFASVFPYLGTPLAGSPSN